MRIELEETTYSDLLPSTLNSIHEWNFALKILDFILQINYMAAKSLDTEIFNYLPLLGNDEKQTILSVIKSYKIAKTC